MTTCRAHLCTQTPPRPWELGPCLLDLDSRRASDLHERLHCPRRLAGPGLGCFHLVIHSPSTRRPFYPYKLLRSPPAQQRLGLGQVRGKCWQMEGGLEGKIYCYKRQVPVTLYLFYSTYSCFEQEGTWSNPPSPCQKSRVWLRGWGSPSCLWGPNSPLARLSLS